jgi:protein-S-isoprenylcysteine O-methyltransferase Ste14
MERRWPWTPGFLLAHAALVLPLAGILAADSPGLALAGALGARGAYAGFVTWALLAQDRSAWFTRRWGVEGGYARFRSAATLLMNVDGAAFVLACWAGRGTLAGPVPAGACMAAGALLAVLGIGVKAWAARALPAGAYTWRSFFVPPGESRWVATGPYRWLRNPMYTLGYAQCWGLALFLRSVPGLWAAAAAQVAILLVNHFAERPHSARLRARAAGSSSPGGPTAVR